MVAELRIRRATLQDKAELARLRWDFSPDEVSAGAQSFADFAQGFAAFLDQALQSGRWAIWVIESQGRLVGNIYGEIVDKVPRPGHFGHRYGYITNVYVEPAVRNQGYGSQLLHRVISWAREESLEFLIVWPSEASIPYYLRAGFVPSPDALELHLESP